MKQFIFLTLIVFLSPVLSFGSSNSLDKNKDGIIITTPSENEIVKEGYREWPIWSSRAITYPKKTYSSTEYCYFIKGEVKVVADSGREYNIKAGDLVIFKKGCTCTWYVSKAVKKHYKFE